MLHVEDLRVFHGPIEAVHGISFEVEHGQCVSLLGPNGAGKTSSISAISGVARSTGRILLDGEDMADRPVEARIRRGIAVAPEGRRVFANLSVEENLRLGGAISAKGLSDRVVDWFDTFPNSRRAQGSTCRNVVGRRATDARHSARTDVLPSDPAPG